MAILILRIMRFKKKQKTPSLIEQILYNPADFPINNSEQGLDFLINFFKEIRPSSKKGRKNAGDNLQRATDHILLNPVLKQKLQRSLLLQLFNTQLNATFTESGIPLADGLWQEFSDRLKHKILPPEQNPNDFLYIIDRIFYKKKDYLWVESIARKEWIAFFEALESSIQASDKRIQKHLNASMIILSFQIAQTGLEKEVIGYCSDNTNTENNPFIEQSYLIQSLKDLYKNEEELAIQETLSVINKTLLACEEEIQHIRNKQQENGTSVRQTYTLLILSARLQRMLVLIDLLDSNKLFNTGRFVDLFVVLVRNEKRKNSIKELFSQGLGYLAYQIAEHKGAKGSTYITASWKEYTKMITSAMWGGLIIVFVTLFKNLLSKLALAPFWQGFLYSINYSAGFIVIEQTGSTLATKQPAFTASAVAASLDHKKTGERPNMNNLAVTVAKVVRSQTASFFGNLLIVFPGTYFIAWLYDIIFGHKIVTGAAAAQLLEDQHPWHSLSLLYACNTGLFLFLSGIIAGYVQNKIRFRKIGARLINHPVLRLSMTVGKREKLAGFIQKNAGTIMGSIALGFFLGMSGTIGKLFGIPFDIRHITISAGNTGIGVYGLGLENIQWSYLTIIFIGVLGVGMFNFIVSFSLAFFVAVKSRGIHLREYPEFLSILWKYFKKYPLDFVRPRKRNTDKSYT